MIDRIRNFFTQMIEPGAATPGVAAEQALHLATAALLLEMMRMDAAITADEIATVEKALKVQFSLDEQQVAALMALAGKEARQATDYFHFTSLINKSFGAGQKAMIIEYMWQVAYADGYLDANEQHFMRKIADLLYVSQADYIAAKQRARGASASSA